MDAAQAAALVTGGAGLLGAVAALTKPLWRRGKDRADAADVITDTALTLVAPLREEIEHLRKELTKARTEVAEVRRLSERERQLHQAEISRLQTRLAEQDRMIARLRGRGR